MESVWLNSGYSGAVAKQNWNKSLLFCNRLLNAPSGPKYKKV